MVYRGNGEIVLEDAEILFRNFEGNEGPYNRAGDRNFCVFLNDGLAQDMAKDGWNIKTRTAREEGDPDRPYVHVTVAFKGRPPKLVLITNKGRNHLTEDEVDFFDWVEIEKVDLIIRPYSWSMSGKSGIKAYLKSLYLTMHEDVLEAKYSHLPMLGAPMHPALAIESGDTQYTVERIDEPQVLGRKTLQLEIEKG